MNLLLTFSAVIYKKAIKVDGGDHPGDRYLHFDSDEGFWVISNDYWHQGKPQDGTNTSYIKYFRSTSDDLDKKCPSDITKWESTQVIYGFIYLNNVPT